MISYFIKQFSILLLISSFVVLIYCCFNSKLFWDKYTNANIVKTEYCSENNYTTIVYTGINENNVEYEFDEKFLGKKENIEKYQNIINSGSFYEINGSNIGVFLFIVTITCIVLIISCSFQEILTMDDITNINNIKMCLWKKYKIFIGYPVKDIEDFCDLFINKYIGIISYSDIEKLYRDCFLKKLN